MELNKLNPILKKESILKTANAAELETAPNDVLERYQSYAMTHVPLGDTKEQMAKLERVITQNKRCAIGNIVGPYGYGKTSTAVHLWNELRKKKILAIPPFQWSDLEELLNAVYHWTRFEFSLGPKQFIPQLDSIFKQYSQQRLEEFSDEFGADTIRKLAEGGHLRLNIQPSDIVGFYSDVSNLGIEAGFQGLAVFTDELQATIAAYQPSRDQFYADLFQIVKDVLGLTGQWAIILTMDDGTEGIIARDRSDMLQRMQQSALYFRVKDVYNRREYPAELWAAFEQRFAFDGREILPQLTLDSIGQIAARPDLGAGPRMVTHAFTLAIQHYDRRQTAYQPLQLVNDFLDGKMVFDQRGKFRTDVNRALQHADVNKSEDHRKLIKLLAAYPMGCSEDTLSQFGLLDVFREFPALARRELIAQQSGGYILRYLAAEEIAPEQIEQRLTKEFVNRFSPQKNYADKAVEGFMNQLLLGSTFPSKQWKVKSETEVNHRDIRYRLALLEGTFSDAYPDRLVALTVAAVPQGKQPEWRKLHPDADIELRFELTYRTLPGEPNGLLIRPDRPDIGVFHLNLNLFEQELAEKQMPDFLFEYYTAPQMNSLLALAFINHLDSNRGEIPDDQYRINAVLSPLRQYALSILFNDRLKCYTDNYISQSVGTRVIEDLFNTLCQRLYPNYQTLNTGRKWQENLQQYGYALETVINEEGVSIARGRRLWQATKEDVADAFHIPGRRLNNLDSLLDTLDNMIEKVDYSGRTPTSMVKLKFKLHPLETDWLERIDASNESVRMGNGDKAPAIPVEYLFDSAKEMGYRQEEIGEVLRLLQTRKYIDHEPRKNMLVRTVDNVDDLKEAVAAQIERMAEQVNLLTSNLPDFEGGRYPITTLRSTLETSQDRDEVEELRVEVREVDSRLRTFLSSRITDMRQRVQSAIESLHVRVRQGIPDWLSESLPKSPLTDILERQRSSLATIYQTNIDELETLRKDVLRDFQSIQVGNPAEEMVSLYHLLRKITDDRGPIIRKLEGRDELKNDLHLWRQVLENSAKVQLYASRTAQQDHGTSQFAKQAEDLWRRLQEELETQPNAVLELHKKVYAQIAELFQSIKSWMDNRREDFLKRCRLFESLFASAEITLSLTIPFDSERPSESYTVLKENIRTKLSQTLDDLDVQLSRASQSIQYAIQVQNLDLRSAEEGIQACKLKIPELRKQQLSIMLDDLDEFSVQIIQPLAALQRERQAINDEVQRSLSRREPEGTEIQLMEMLRTHASSGRVDLRSLILQLINQRQEDVVLKDLMDTLQSLFQKNQITIHINLMGD